MKPSIEYSGVDPNLLIYEGKQYSHLRNVLEEKTSGVPRFPNLSLVQPPLMDIDDSVIKEEREETELLTKDESKYSGLLARWGISFQEVKMGPVLIDSNVFASAVIQAGGDMISKARSSFGNTRVDDALIYPDLGAITPHVQHLVHLGKALEYDKSFAVSKPSGLQLTHASLTFEGAATLMPILHALLFCGKLYNGNEKVAFDLRKGFTLGLFPTTKNGNYIMRHRSTAVRQLVDEMWHKGGSYTVPDDDQSKWESWVECNQFHPRSRSKGSSIRDLVRFCWNKYKVAFVVQDRESAAIAFGLAQVGLCRIEALDMGPVDGVIVYGKNEHQKKAIHLESSVMENFFDTYSYKFRQNRFDTCKVPFESEKLLMNWLDDQIDKTHLLGIANGDRPGTVILTPEFFLFAKTAGRVSSLGKDIAEIANAISRKCAFCDGVCKGLFLDQGKKLYKSRDNCTTVLFLNTLLSIYVGGVLLKAGMTIDQCSACSQSMVTWKALERLRFATNRGLESVLTCWFILRTGKDTPKGQGHVLGIEMEGQVHGLRYAIEPSTTGSPLVSFPGHIFEGRQTCSCLVFEWCYLPNDIVMDKARSVEITEKAPDVPLQQLLFIRSKPDRIAVDTCLAFPDGEIVQVQLGGHFMVPENQHRCVDVSKNLYATPLHVSECTNGSSVISTRDTGLRFAVYTFGNEAIQSWVCGMFPAKNIIFQGRRSLAHSLALLKEDDILIQGFRDNTNAIQDGHNLEREVG